MYFDRSATQSGAKRRGQPGWIAGRAPTGRTGPRGFCHRLLARRVRARAFASRPSEAPSPFEHQECQTDRHDADRDQRAPQHDARGGGEDARSVRSDLEFKPLAEELVQRTGPGEHVSPLQRAVAVVCGDPPLGPHPDLGAFLGSRARARPRPDRHGEVEPSVAGRPVAAFAPEKWRVAKRRNRVERHIRLNPSTARRPGARDGQPRPGEPGAEPPGSVSSRIPGEKLGR